MKFKCTCENVGQDSIHGEHMRVANKTAKTVGSKPVYKCTVCGKEHTTKGE